MSLPNRAALALLVAALVAGAADGAELVPAISSEIGYDSNNAGRTQNEDPQARIRTTPEITLRETLGRLAFDANLRIAYDNAIDFNDADDFFDQFANLGVVWQATSRTQLSLANQFARVENIDSAIGIDGFTLEEIPANQEQRTRNLSNRSVVTLSHRLTSRWTALVSADYVIRDFQTQTEADRKAYSGTSSLSYALNARTVLRFGGRVTYDSYDQTRDRQGTRTRYYNPFVGVEYQIAPDLRMSASVGPAWYDQDTKPDGLTFRTYPFVTSFLNFTPEDFLDPSADPSLDYGFVLDQMTCPAIDGVRYASVFSAFNPSGCLVTNFTPVLLTNTNNPLKGGQPQRAGDFGESDGLDVFGGFELVKSWEWGDIGLSYNRRESSGGTENGSATADSVSLVVSGFEPAPRWLLSGLFNFTHRESTGRTPDDIPAVVAVDLLVDENGIINGPGTLTPIIGAGESDGFVSVGSFANADETSSYFVRLRAERRLTENLESYAVGSWRRQEESGEQASGDDLDQFRIFFGLRYTFDPLLF